MQIGNMLSSQVNRSSTTSVIALVIVREKVKAGIGNVNIGLVFLKPHTFRADIKSKGGRRIRVRILCVQSSFLTSSATFSAKIRIVAIPSSSFHTSPGSLPKTMFQYVDPTTIMSFTR